MERKTKYLLIGVLVLGLLTVLYLIIGLALPPVFKVLAGGMLNDIGNLGQQGAITTLVNAITIAVVACMAWAMYFLPALLAFQSRHTKDNAIFWIDLLLGWTLFGWFVAFFWVMRGNDTASDGDEEAQAGNVALARPARTESDDA
jgi:hypothetical protein